MAFADPASNISQLDIKPGTTVVDFGAGTGFYSLAAARAVGSHGKVYAVEVQKDLLDRLKNTASREGLHTIEVIWGDIEKSGGTRLRNASVDFVIISNVLFQAEDRSGTISEAHRILKQGGKALLIEWSDSSSVSGPDPRHVIPENEAKTLFEQKSFSVGKNISAGEHHYGFIAVKT